MFEIHPAEGFHFSQCLKDRMRGGNRLLRLRGSSVVHLFSGSFVAEIFFMVGFTCSVPVVHAQMQKNTVTPPKASAPPETEAWIGKKPIPAAKLAPREKVNMSSASKEKVEVLPGLPQATLAAILVHLKRIELQKNGPIESTHSNQ